MYLCVLLTLAGTPVSGTATDVDTHHLPVNMYLC
jgi:hypothetical protein